MDHVTINTAISLCTEYFNICKEIQRSTAIIKTQLCYDADQRGVLRHVQLALLGPSNRDQALADCNGCRVAFDEILHRKQLRRRLSAVKSKIRRLGEKAGFDDDQIPF